MSGKLARTFAKYPSQYTFFFKIYFPPSLSGFPVSLLRANIYRELGQDGTKEDVDEIRPLVAVPLVCAYLV